MHGLRFVVALTIASLAVPASGQPPQPPSPPGAFTQWQAKLASPDPGERRRAIVVLTDLLPDPTAAAPHLATALGDPHEVVRLAATDALRQIGPAATPDLIVCLASADREVRLLATGILGSFGQEAVGATSALAALLSDHEDDVREAAAAVLRTLGPEVLPEVIPALGSPEPAARRAAIDVIREFGPQSAAAVEPLVALLEDGDARVRGAAAAALEAIGESAGPAAERLNALLGDEDEEVRGAALMALARIDGFLPDSIDELEELAARDRRSVEASDDERRLVDDRAAAAAAALVLLRPDVESSRLLRRQVARRPLEVRRAMIDALVRARLGQEWQSDIASTPIRIALRAWNAALDSDDAELREAVLFATYYSMVAPDDRLAMPVLRLQSPTARTRRDALLRLASFGREVQGAAPRAIELLADDDVAVRRAAARALGSIDVGSEVALGALAEATRADDVGLRCEAIKALGKLGVRSKVVLEAVAEALEDEDDAVRTLARWAEERLAEGPADDDGASLAPPDSPFVVPLTTPRE